MKVPLSGRRQIQYTSASSSADPISTSSSSSSSDAPISAGDGDDLPAEEIPRADGGAGDESRGVAEADKVLFKLAFDFVFDLAAGIVPDVFCFFAGGPFFAIPFFVVLLGAGRFVPLLSVAGISVEGIGAVLSTEPSVAGAGDCLNDTTGMKAGIESRAEDAVSDLMSDDVTCESVLIGCEAGDGDLRTCEGPENC